MCKAPLCFEGKIQAVRAHTARPGGFLAVYQNFFFFMIHKLMRTTSTLKAMTAG